MRKYIIVGALAFLLVPGQARADWLFTPFVGGTFGPGVAHPDLAWPDRGSELSYGASLGFMGGGILGLEFDLGHSPRFFQDLRDQDVAFVDRGNVTTLMANVILGAPLDRVGAGIRPYATAGGGLFRTRVDDIDQFFDINENHFGVNVGGGVMGFVTDNVGIRGDVRYFRNLGVDTRPDAVTVELGRVDFWRGTVGLTFRF